MKLLVDIPAEHGFYGPFRGELSGLVDSTGSLAMVADPRIESEADRTEIAGGVARAVNAQIAAERRRAA